MSTLKKNKILDVLKKQLAFTLAEVLITLTIIGVIAAITIPNLMQNYRKHEIETGLKQAYSILSNALKMAQADTGFRVSEMVTNSANISDTSNEARAVNFSENYLVPYLKIHEKCKSNCKIFPYEKFYIDDTRTIYAYEDSNKSAYVFSLDNGMLFAVTSLFSNVRIVFDINGAKGPNRFARDIFAVTLSPRSDNLLFRNSTDTGTTSVTRCELGGDTMWGCAYLIMRNGWKIPDDYPIKKF